MMAKWSVLVLFFCMSWTRAVIIPVKYLGCWMPESGSKAQYAVGTFRSRYKVPRVSVDSCVYKCFAERFKMAAMTKGNECYCGYSTKRLVTRSDDFCFVPCLGNCHQRCGGLQALSIYQTGYQREPYLFFGKWTLDQGYIGCFRRRVLGQACNKQSLKPPLKTPRMTPYMCTMYCFAGKGDQRLPISAFMSTEECCCGTRRWETHDMGHRVDDWRCFQHCAGAKVGNFDKSQCVGFVDGEKTFATWDNYNIHQHGLPHVDLKVFDHKKGWIIPDFKGNRFETPDGVKQYLLDHRPPDKVTRRIRRSVDNLQTIIARSPPPRGVDSLQTHRRVDSLQTTRSVDSLQTTRSVDSLHTLRSVDSLHTHRSVDSLQTHRSVDSLQTTRSVDSLQTTMARSAPHPPPRRKVDSSKARAGRKAPRLSTRHTSRAWPRWRSGHSPQDSIATSVLLLLLQTRGGGADRLQTHTTTTSRPDPPSRRNASPLQTNDSSNSSNSSRQVEERRLRRLQANSITTRTLPLRERADRLQTDSPRLRRKEDAALQTDSPRLRRKEDAALQTDSPRLRRKEDAALQTDSARLRRNDHALQTDSVRLGRRVHGLQTHTMAENGLSDATPFKQNPSSHTARNSKSWAFLARKVLERVYGKEGRSLKSAPKNIPVRGRRVNNIISVNLTEYALIRTGTKTGVPQLWRSTQKGVPELWRSIENSVPKLRRRTPKGVPKLWMRTQNGIPELWRSTQNGMPKLQGSAQKGVPSLWRRLGMPKLLRSTRTSMPILLSNKNGMPKSWSIAKNGMPKLLRSNKNSMPKLWRSTKKGMPKLTKSAKKKTPKRMKSIKKEALKILKVAKKEILNVMKHIKDTLKMTVAEFLKVHVKNLTLRSQTASPALKNDRSSIIKKILKKILKNMNSSQQTPTSDKEYLNTRSVHLKKNTTERTVTDHDKINTNKDKIQTNKTPNKNGPSIEQQLTRKTNPDTNLISKTSTYTKMGENDITKKNLKNLPNNHSVETHNKSVQKNTTTIHEIRKPTSLLFTKGEEEEDMRQLYSPGNGNRKRKKVRRKRGKRWVKEEKRREEKMPELQGRLESDEEGGGRGRGRKRKMSPIIDPDNTGVMVVDIPDTEEQSTSVVTTLMGVLACLFLFVAIGVVLFKKKKEILTIVAEKTGRGADGKKLTGSEAAAAAAAGGGEQPGEGGQSDAAYDVQTSSETPAPESEDNTGTGTGTATEDEALRPLL